MRTLNAILIMLAAAIISTPAQTTKTWEGYLADQMCGSNWKGTKGEERAKKHSRACGLEESCAASGYGVFTNGVFVKFTDASSPKAKAYLESITAKNDIRVRVTGTLESDKISVVSIETATPRSGSKPARSKPQG
jgi:hypothetical protein